MKVCSRCKIEKDIERFCDRKTSRDGKNGECRDCVRDYNKVYRHKNKTLVKARIIKYRANNRDKVVDYKKKYRASNPEKEKALKAVYRATKKGVITRPDKCEMCNKLTKYIDAHHGDYNKPLDVVWLCKKCHKEVHLNLEN